MRVKLSLTPRQHTSTWLALSSQAATVVLALAVAAIALIAIGSNPAKVYEYMFLHPFTNPYQATRVINRGAPLILAGLAVYLPLRSDLYNIGAQGQFILGGIVTVWVGLNAPSMLGVSGNGIVVMLVALLAAAVVGLVWAIVPVYLKVTYNVNEILTTLMLVFTAERLNTFLVTGPMQAPVSALPHTESIAFSLPKLFGTQVDVGIVLALLAVAGTWVLVNKTRLGYEIILSGSNDDVAKQTGINAAKITLVVFSLAAAFAGLAGFIEIAGNQQNLTSTWYPGYGWTAIPIALLGRRGSIQTLLSALLFAILFVGSLTVNSTLSVPASISNVIEALIILFLIAAEFIKTYRVDVVVGDRSTRASIYRLLGFESTEEI